MASNLAAPQAIQNIAIPLDPKIYTLAEDELEFYRKETGIQDADEIKEHILQVQAEAYAVHPYPCIWRFSFTKLKISHYPAYKELLKLGKERPDALLLDIGCCFGNDVRKAVVDGFPMDQALASDLRPAFWDLGHKLFKSTPETFPVPFLAGDVFDPEFLQVVPPSTSVPATPMPPLKELKNLTPLNGRLSAIHASAFFHLFDEAQNFTVAKAFAGLLSPEPGSIIFGSHRGDLEEGVHSHASRMGHLAFSHNVESWNEMWNKVFEEGQVKSQASLHEVERKDVWGIYEPDRKFFLLEWVVTRL